MTQIYADMESKPAYRNPGGPSEPLIILGIGFIQIESVKSVVKNLGFGCGSAVPGVSWANNPPSRSLARLYVQPHEESQGRDQGSFREWGVKLVAGSFLGHDRFGH
jgi:hypothetical protein